MSDIKKILLVVPNFNWVEAGQNLLWSFIPYNLCLIAAQIENSYEVKIIDANLENYSKEDFEKRIITEKPDVVGITALMDYFGPTAHKVAEITKRANYRIICIMGGVYATTNSEKAIKDKNIDFVVAGEGEYAFEELLQYIKGDVKKIPKGVFYKKKGNVCGEGRTKLIEKLDQIPFPAYHLIDYKRYIYSVNRNSVDRPTQLPFARIMTSRGCPYNCCFCQVESISGRKFRARSAKNVLNEIEWLQKEYAINSIIFDDDNLFTDRKRAKEIITGLIGKNIEWKSIATAAFLLDDELLDLMKASGCKYIDIAIESGTQRILHEIIKKPLDFDKVKKVVNKAKKIGLFVAANFIVGFPTESWDEIRQTLRYAEEIDVDYAKIFNAVPLPNTELMQLALKTNALIDGYDSEKIDWKRGWLQTADFSANDLTVLRAFEWDRINFSDPQKIAKIAKFMQITEEKLYEIRRSTIQSVYNNLI